MANKMTKDIVPNNFTVGLSLVDAVPVLLFCFTMAIVGKLLGSYLFISGAFIAFIAGSIKVLWKIIVALKRKNIWWMFVQMRIFMPIGFVLMLVGYLLSLSRINLSVVWASVISFPAVIFFVIGVLGMVLMTVFAIKLDSSDVKSNWIEQITNGVAQLAFLIGVLICML